MWLGRVDRARQRKGTAGIRRDCQRRTTLTDPAAARVAQLYADKGIQDKGCAMVEHALAGEKPHLLRAVARVASSSIGCRCRGAPPGPTLAGLGAQSARGGRSMNERGASAGLNSETPASSDARLLFRSSKRRMTLRYERQRGIPTIGTRKLPG